MLLSRRLNRNLKRLTLRSFTNESSPYTQINEAPFTSNLEILDTSKLEPFKVYRVLNNDGKPINKNFEMPFSNDIGLKMYETMVLERKFDEIFYKLARMNLISFYMQNFGEEASQIGSIAALETDDYIYSQYRELGSFLYRGVTCNELANTNYSNINDSNIGRQMPIHYGSKKLNMITISSPLSTQMPQACGTAYGLNMKNKNNCVLCYFGEGAASEGDAMVGFNMSSILNCSVLWFCRNNGWAISTPTKDQYKGDGIVSRAYGFGMYGCRFDGKDIFATYIATKKARDISIKEKRPVLLEAMTYRAAHHSTSDDSKTYRNENDEYIWNTKYNPIERMKNYLIYIGLWNDLKQKDLDDKCYNIVNNARENAESQLKPHWKTMFQDVYKNQPERLKQQMNEMENHLNKFDKEEFYQMSQYSTEFDTTNKD